MDGGERSGGLWRLVVAAGWLAAAAGAIGCGSGSSSGSGSAIAGGHRDDKEGSGGTTGGNPGSGGASGGNPGSGGTPTVLAAKSRRDLDFRPVRCRAGYTAEPPPR